MGNRIVRVLSVLALVTGLTFTSGAASNAKTSLPSVGLLSVVNSTAISRFPGEPLFIQGGVFVVSTNGAFELWARRTADGIDVTQIVRNSGKITTVRHLPSDDATSFDFGIGGFFHLTWKDGSGATVSQQDVAFCPAGYDTTRVNDSGPIGPQYPQGCGSSELSRATVWGIDQGWGTGALSNSFIDDPGVPDGTYTLQVAIADKYARALEIPSSQRSKTLSVDLSTVEDPCPDPEVPCPIPFTASARARTQARANRNVGATPDVSKTADGAPDLIPFPAFAMDIFPGEGDGRDYLVFAANVWNAGPGPLVVEGFRSTDAQVMQATQYLYGNGKRVKKVSAGSFEYDPREGHQHWHFQDFAAYALLNANGSKVVDSEKQAFCIAPTDAIDMTVPGAEWQPYGTGFFSACGSPDSIWIREVMPVGWGDTYFQYIPGQSFDVTDLPNGEYIVQVTTNIGHHLTETHYDNNVSLRHVILGGEPGARTAEML